MLKTLSLFVCLLLIICNPVRGGPCDNPNGERYDALSGHIYSPGYLENKTYPANSICRYEIHAPEDHRIRLSFEDLDVEVANACINDWIDIITDPEEEMIICGSGRPRDILSTMSVVSILFQSDYIINKRGFHISYVVTKNTSLCKMGELECKNRNCVSLASSCNGKDDCGDGTDEEKCGFPIPPVSKCGIPEIEMDDSDDRIVGGKGVVHGSWPWQADFQMDGVYPVYHFCGGTLLNSQWILTASHCMEGDQRRKKMVVLGNHDKFLKEDSEQVRFVDRFILYPGIDDEHFNYQFDMYNDLALVKLNAPVEITKYVKPACLPQQNEELALGRVCYATGWGETRGSGDDNILKQMKGQILSGLKCKNDFVEFRNESMVCYGYMPGGHGLCSGDSGGPLVCEKDKVWTVYGDTSFTTDMDFLVNACGVTNSPTAYSKVSSKIDWIYETMEAYS